MVTLATEVRGVKAGSKIGRRVVLGCPFVTGRSGSASRIWSLVVQCECGRVSVVSLGSLLEGRSNGCGSCHSRKKATTHGGANKPRVKLYSAWASMRNRCNRETHRTYRWYGGRGIKVCEAWNDYSEFRTWALANGYREGLSIDRIDNDKGYSPENCQWLTPSANIKKQWIDKRRKAADKK